MTITEDLLSKRELVVFLGVENHSMPYNPLLFDDIWTIPNSLLSKDLLIVPINGLDELYKLSKERITCYGRALWVLFVDSSFFTHYAFLFDSFPQTDENNYFSKEQLVFLRKTNCINVAICDMGVYKSRSLVNMLNSAITTLEEYNISVCLATILGYNSRGYTDIEIEDESKTYQKEYYLQSDIDATVMNDNFNFIQIDGKIKLSTLLSICCHTKSQVEIFLQHIKQEAKPYETLKTLLDYGFIRKTIESLNKGESFDFVSLERNLIKMGFKGNLIDTQWDYIYDKLCRNIKMSSPNKRNEYVQELIKAIGNNINSTINFVKSI